MVAARVALPSKTRGVRRHAVPALAGVGRSVVIPEEPHTLGVGTKAEGHIRPNSGIHYGDL
jgi:hypothetical protein